MCYHDCFHFTDKETEAQKGQVSSHRLHSTSASSLHRDTWILLCLLQLTWSCIPPAPGGSESLCSAWQVVCVQRARNWNHLLCARRASTTQSIILKAQWGELQDAARGARETGRKLGGREGETGRETEAETLRERHTHKETDRVKGWGRDWERETKRETRRS